MTTYWRDSYDRLEQPRNGIDGDTLKWARYLKRQRTICQRAQRAGAVGRPFEAGDPKTGEPWPPSDEVRLAYECGVDEAAYAVQWRLEREQARKMTEMRVQARKVLRPAMKQRAARRQVRVRRAVRLAGLWSPGMARRMRRALRS